MIVIDKIKDRYLNFRISQYNHEKIRFKINTKVTWNRLSRIGVHRYDETFMVKGYYQQGVETECGQYIANFWLKKVKPHTFQEQML